jgi:hypothetical protein
MEGTVHENLPSQNKLWICGYAIHFIHIISGSSNKQAPLLNIIFFLQKVYKTQLNSPDVAGRPSELSDVSEAGDLSRKFCRTRRTDDG